MPILYNKNIHSHAQPGGVLMYKSAALLLLLTLLTLLWTSSIAIAQPLNVFEARSMAMGGTSVASSRLANAAFTNPALIAKPTGDSRFQLLLPIIGVYTVDSQGLIDDINNYNDTRNAGDLISAATILLNSLGKPLTLHGFAGTAFGFSTDSFSAVVFYDTQLIVDGRTLPNIAQQDGDLQGRGVKLVEAGLAFPVIGSKNLKIGITPKVVNATTYDFFQLISTLADGNNVIDEKGEKDNGSDFNLDVGLAYHFTDSWTFGLVGRNLLEQEYDTLLGNKIFIKPNYRAAFSYNGSAFTFAIDADLNENDAIAFGEKTQLIALGVEFNAFNWMAIRGGYQQNIASNTNLDLFSFGLGFTPFGVGIDVSAIGNENAIGGALQLSFTF